jgi:hypothetical protein
LTQVRAKLKQHADGDRQFVKVLAAVLDHGLAAVEAACAEALGAGIASGDVILTVLARRPRHASGMTTVRSASQVRACDESQDRKVARPRSASTTIRARRRCD